MGWKDTIKLGDYEPTQMFEVLCKTCSAVRIVEAREWQSRKGANMLYLSEIETRARCRQRGCHGHVRLAIVRDETSSFVGGLA